MATATKKPATQKPTKKGAVRALIGRYQAAHPGKPFTTKQVVDWATQQGLLNPVGGTLSTTTPAGIAAFDPDCQAAAFESRLDAWRADWLRYLLAMHAIEDYRLALRVILTALADGQGLAFPRERVAELAGDLGRPANRAVQIARAGQPVEVLMQLAADLLWTGEPLARTLIAYDVELLAESAGIYLAAHWKADLAGPLTARLFDLFSIDQLADYAKQINMANIPRNKEQRKKLAASIIAHPRTPDHLPACIKPVALDPPKKGRRK